MTGSYSRKRADGSSPTGSEPLSNAELEPLGGKIPDEDPRDFEVDSRLGAYEWVFYYAAVIFLALQILFSGFVFLAGVVQLPYSKSANPRNSESSAFVVTQMLQSLVVVSIGVLLLGLLLTENVRPWVALAGTCLLSVGDTLFRRVHQKSAKRIEQSTVESENNNCK
mgnify:CR=1 FL=1